MGNTSPEVYFEPKPLLKGSAKGAEGYKAFKAREKVDAETMQKERLEHGQIVGDFANMMIPILENAEGKSTFFAPGMLHTALTNLAFGAGADTEKEFLKILKLDSVLGGRSILEFQGNHEINRSNDGTILDYRARNGIFVPKGTKLHAPFIDDSWRTSNSYFDLVNYKTERGRAWLAAYLFRNGGLRLSRGVPTVPETSSIVVLSGIDTELSWQNEFKIGKPASGLISKVTTIEDCIGTAEDEGDRILVARAGNLEKLLIISPADKSEKGLLAAAAKYCVPSKALEVADKAHPRAGLNVVLPIVAQTSTLSATEHLKKQGLSGAFGDTANFSKAAASPVHLTDVHCVSNFTLDHCGLITARNFGTNLRDSSRPGPRVKAAYKSKRSDKAPPAETGPNSFDVRENFVVIAIRRKTGEPIVVGVVRKPQDVYTDATVPHPEKEGSTIEAWMAEKAMLLAAMKAKQNVNPIVKIARQQALGAIKDAIMQVMNPAIEGIFEGLKANASQPPLDTIVSSAEAGVKEGVEVSIVEFLKCYGFDDNKPFLSFDDVQNLSSLASGEANIDTAIAVVDRIDELGDMAVQMAKIKPREEAPGDEEEINPDDIVEEEKLPYAPGVLDIMKQNAMTAGIEGLKAGLKKMMVEMIMAVDQADPLIFGILTVLTEMNKRVPGEVSPYVHLRTVGTPSSNPEAWELTEDDNLAVYDTLYNVLLIINDPRISDPKTKKLKMAEAVVEALVDGVFAKIAGAVEARRKNKVMARLNERNGRREATIKSELEEEEAWIKQSATSDAPPTAVQDANIPESTSDGPSEPVPTESEEKPAEEQPATEQPAEEQPAEPEA
ncbi:hypothetical protein BLNAU_19968 [Blattamonas nauphoetae]|uniref:Serpin domain-containing protein n=1 Tax=Blattamonas nauphoetae TaxID=2049346 RepID=A0ABQ9X030_9EUKA|nr:hypothetical protein BLNAU_19968 [Blattamonas nauphoetae]